MTPDPPELTGKWLRKHAGVKRPDRVTDWINGNYDGKTPIRYAGAAMSLTFVFGIVCTWLGPETKGKPLPE